MAIITTKNSNRNEFLTFLSTYPSDSGTLNLKSTGGYNTVNYTGEYWRPTDSSNNTSKVTDGSSKIELGFNVHWGEMVTSGTNKGKVEVHVSFMICEYQYWLMVTNYVSNASSTTITRGYNYKFTVNGNNYDITAPINEVIGYNADQPYFSQTVGGVNKAYSFKSGVANKEYINSHCTELWGNTYYVTPSNGKAKITINLDHIFLHWKDIYNYSRPTIWCGNASKTFTSTSTYYTNNVSMTSNVNIAVAPKTANINFYSNATTTTNDRRFWTYCNINKTVITKANANITAYKDTASNTTHQVKLTNNDSGTTIGATAWTTDNKNAITITPTSNSTYTNVKFNSAISNCKVNCKLTNANITKTCNVKITANKTVTFSSNNTSMATVNNSTGEIVAKQGRNGTYIISSKFNGGLTVNTSFQSWLVPNGISLYCYAYNTTTPVTTINSGEKVTLMAKATPYYANNSSISVCSNFRQIAFSITSGNGTLTNAVAVSNNIPYYKATYTAPNVNSNQTVTIKAIQPNTFANSNSPYPRNIFNTVTLTVKTKTVSTLPNLQITVKSVNPNPVRNNGYCLVTYDVTAVPGETLTIEQRQFLANQPLTFIGQTYTTSNYKTVATKQVSTQIENLIITNPKRQAIYKVVATALNGYTFTSDQLDWKSQASLNIISTGTNITTQFTHKLRTQYLFIDPQRLVLNVDQITNPAVSYIGCTANEITETDIKNTTPYNGVATFTTGVIKSVGTDHKTPQGTVAVKGVSSGTTSFNIAVPSENLSDTCHIYVVDPNMISSIIYPYVYTYNTNLVYDSIKYNGQESLRLVFSLPDANTFRLFSNIIITINYSLNGVTDTISYSLLDNPECFSLTYPMSETPQTDLDYMYRIITMYKAYFNMNPYCIFQEPTLTSRDLTANINSFVIQYNIKPEYSYTEINGLIKTVNVNNRYNIEDVNVGDRLFGYDSNNPNGYSLKSYVEAFKSYTKGYTTSTDMQRIINDNTVQSYFNQLCDLNDFGAKGTPISVLPFYNFLLAQNFIRALDRKLMANYFNVACFIKGLITNTSGSSYTMSNIPNNFYPNYTRNMYTTEEQNIKYDLRNSSKTLAPLYENNTADTLTIDAEDEYYICANDNNGTFYDNENMPNTFKTSEWFDRFTISPLSEFTANLPINKVDDVTSYTAIMPTTTNIPLLPVMQNMIGVFISDSDSYDSSSRIWKNKLNNGYNFIFGNQYQGIQNDSQLIRDMSLVMNPSSIIAEIDFGTNLTNYTIYLKCKANNVNSSVEGIITFLSTLTFDLSKPDLTTGFSLGSYESIISANSGGSIQQNNSRRGITLTNGSTFISNKNIGSDNYLDNIHTYVISVSNGNSAQLYVDRDDNVDIVGTLNGTFTTNIVRLFGYINDDLTMQNSYMSYVYYKYIAIATSTHNQNQIRANVEYIRNNRYLQI